MRAPGDHRDERAAQRPGALRAVGDVHRRRAGHRRDPGMGLTERPVTEMPVHQLTMTVLMTPDIRQLRGQRPRRHDSQAAGRGGVCVRQPVRRALRRHGQRRQRRVPPADPSGRAGELLRGRESYRHAKSIEMPGPVTQAWLQIQTGAHAWIGADPERPLDGKSRDGVGRLLVAGSSPSTWTFQGQVTGMELQLGSRSSTPGPDPKLSAAVLRTGRRNRLKPPFKSRQRGALSSQTRRLHRGHG